MLFGARSRPSIGRKLRQLLWPRSGWLRAGAYLRHRLARLPGTPYSIAAGFACGAAMSFTPFIGLHFVLAALLAWLIGGNLLASALGTAVGNPWTFPFIWVWLYKLGSWILGWETASDASMELSLSYLIDNARHLLLPMLVGSLPTAAVVWVVFYWPLVYMVEGYQHARRVRRNRAAARRGRLQESSK